MVVGLDSYEGSIADGCRRLLEALDEIEEKPSCDLVLRQEISSFHFNILKRIRGVVRIAFKSRDRDLEIIGLGASEIIKPESHQDIRSLSQLMVKSQSLSKDQVYFGGIRFDENSSISEEWGGFSYSYFVLPTLLIIKRNGAVNLTLSYRLKSHLCWEAFCDHAKTILSAINNADPKEPSMVAYDMREISPRVDEYLSKVNEAIKYLGKDPDQQKVVMGRRRTVSLKEPVDPARLFLRLASTSHDSFLFFIDSGSSAFFGKSPELLFRRTNNNIETESLAGTRARSDLYVDDEQLGRDLFMSIKDNHEHALVCRYIERSLCEIGVRDLNGSNLELMKLAHVQHLLRRYSGKIPADITDAHIIDALHPTPAVCGFSPVWARAFITKHEGFDRGFYAGPVGFLARDESEFAVGIRSALYRDQSLYVYVASGIVQGSIPDNEWEELDNKEKTILSIFHHDPSKDFK